MGFDGTGILIFTRLASLRIECYLFLSPLSSNSLRKEVRSMRDAIVLGKEIARPMSCEGYESCSGDRAVHTM